MPRFSNTVSAICYTLIQEEYLQEKPRSFVRCNETVRFVAGEMKLMPSYLQKGMWLVTHLFSYYSFLKTGRFFHQLNPDRRWILIAAWKRSRFAFLRDFIRFYESLSSLAWFSQLEERSG